MTVVEEHRTQRPGSCWPRVPYFPMDGREEPVPESCPPQLERSPFTSTYPVFVTGIRVLQNVLWLKKCGLAHTRDWT